MSHLLPDSRSPPLLNQDVLTDLAKIYWLAGPGTPSSRDLDKYRGAATTCAVLMWNKDTWDNARETSKPANLVLMDPTATKETKDIVKEINAVIRKIADEVKKVNAQLAEEIRYCLEDYY